MKYALFLISLAAFGQNIQLNRITDCPGIAAGQARILAFVGVTAGGGTVSVPLCLDLPTGIKYNATNGKLELTLPALPSTPTRRIQTDKFAVPNDPVSPQATMSVTLSKMPVVGSSILVFFRASSWLGEVQDPVVAGAGKLLTVTIPPRGQSAPGAPPDMMTLIYLTEE